MNSESLLKEFHRICYKIVSIEKNTGQLPYAKSYADVGLDLTTMLEVESQIPYIQGNLKEWTGEEARATKSKLKEIHKAAKKEVKQSWE